MAPVVAPSADGDLPRPRAGKARYLVPTDASLVRPAEDGVRGQLRAIVADDRRPTPPETANGVVRLKCYAPARDRRPGDERQAFACAVVDHRRQGAEAPPVGELIGDEVQTSALIGP